MELTPPKFDPTEPQPFQAKPVCPFCGYVEKDITKSYSLISINADTERGLCKMRCTTCKGEWVSQPFALSVVPEEGEIPESVRKAFLDHYETDRQIAKVLDCLLGVGIGLAGAILAAWFLGRL